MIVSIVSDLASLAELAAPWRALAAAQDNFFASPDWLLPWWQAYGATLEATLCVVTVTDGDRLIGLAPLYRRNNKVGPVEVIELRLFGDAGPRPGPIDLLAAAGEQQRVAQRIATALRQDMGEWDVMEWVPLAEPSSARAHVISRLADAGLHVESSAAAGHAYRLALSLLEATPPELPRRFAVHAIETREELARAVFSVRRLSRLEWAERDESSPLASAEASALLEQVVATTSGVWGMRLELDDEPVAIALVLQEGQRATLLAGACDVLDPGLGLSGLLLRHIASEARRRGAISLDVMSVDYPSPGLTAVARHPLAVRVWNKTKAGSVHRTYSSVVRGARVARHAPGAAASHARAAWAKLRGAATTIAPHTKFELLRGQLWTRGLPKVSGLHLHPLTLAWYEACDESKRELLAAQLELPEARVREFLARGDIAILAELEGRAAGVAWVARGRVFLPELEREITLAKYDCILHDVFVAPAMRGHSIAPAMLEEVAEQLRQLDLYRSWSLVPLEQPGAVRAFRKAGFTPVCDVTVAKRSGQVKIVVSPPDPEAREMLGLSRAKSQAGESGG